MALHNLIVISCSTEIFLKNQFLRSKYSSENLDGKPVCIFKFLLLIFFLGTNLFINRLLRIKRKVNDRIPGQTTLTKPDLPSP